MKPPNWQVKQPHSFVGQGACYALLAFLLLIGCNSGNTGPSIVLSNDSLSLVAKAGQTVKGQFSIENTGSSTVSYSINIPSADSWLQLTPSTASLPTKAKQVVEASVTCPNQASSLESKVNIAVTGSSSLNTPFTVKLKCEAADITPNDFAFINVTDAPIDSDVTSAPVPITGIDAATPVSASNNAIVLVNNAPATTINDGQSLSVRLKSSVLFDTTVTTAVTVGTLVRNFSVTTRKAPKLSLSLNPAVLSILKGSSKDTTVTLERNGVAGAATVTASGLPNGVSVNALSIPGGANTGDLSFTVANSASVGGPFDVVVSASTDGVVASQVLKLSIAGASNEPLNITGYQKLFECVQDASLEAGEHQSGHTGIDDGFTRFY
jgi:hypothetical protein